MHQFCENIMTKTLTIKLCLFSNSSVLLLCIIVCTVKAALLAINNAINGPVAEELLVALQSEVLDLKDVMPNIAKYYCSCLIKQKSKKQDVSAVVIYMLYKSMMHLIITCYHDEPYCEMTY